MPELGHAQIHHDDAGHAARRIHDHEQKTRPRYSSQALVSSDSSTEASTSSTAPMMGPEESRPAQEGEQQIAARAHHADAVHGRDDLEIDGRQATADAGKKPAMMKAK